MYQLIFCRAELPCKIFGSDPFFWGASHDKKYLMRCLYIWLTSWLLDLAALEVLVSSCLVKDEKNCMLKFGADMPALFIHVWSELHQLIKVRNVNRGVRGILFRWAKLARYDVDKLCRFVLSGYSSCKIDVLFIR